MRCLVLFALVFALALALGDAASAERFTSRKRSLFASRAGVRGMVKWPAAGNPQNIADATWQDLVALDPFSVEDSTSKSYMEVAKKMYLAGLKFKAASKSLEATGGLPLNYDDMDVCLSGQSGGTTDFIKTNNVVITVFAVKCKSKGPTHVLDVFLSTSKNLPIINWNAPAGNVPTGAGGACPGGGNAKCSFLVKQGQYTANNANQRSGAGCANGNADPDMNGLRRLRHLQDLLKTQTAAAKTNGWSAGDLVYGICQNTEKTPRPTALYFDERSICACCQWEMENPEAGATPLPKRADYWNSGTNESKYDSSSFLKIIMGPLQANRPNPSGGNDIACSVPWGQFPPHIYGAANGKNC